MIQPSERTLPFDPSNAAVYAGDGAAAASHSVKAIAAELKRLIRLYPLTVIGTALVLALAVVTLGLLAPKTYTAKASFIADSPDNARLTSLAAQFGVALPTGDVARSPDFYAALLSSREVLESVILKQYEFTADGHSFRGNLIQLDEISGASEGDRRDRALTQLANNLHVSVGVRTGLISFSLRSRLAPLASQMAQQILDQVNAFNVRSQQARAKAQREFAEQRLNEVRAELSVAENELAAFDMRNRDVQSPTIKLQRDRLDRAVNLRQQVYTSLEQIYEQARIDAERNTPSVTVVDSPIVPYRRDSRFLAAKALLSLLFGGALGLAIAYYRERRARARSVAIAV
jgi:uncharacterized protein involved in exopolysaccharide biosynthesis